MKSVPVQTACPMCHEVGHLHLATTNIEVPYFGDALETTLRCEACGFRHADFMILQQREPVRLTLAASTEEDLRVRVIRSNSGTIRIPQLGFTAEPTPLSESFVSNVEGVLDRAETVLRTAMSMHGDDPEKRVILERYLATWDDLVHARQPFTLIIDDPFGNSAIVSERVEKRPLTEEEVAELRTGMIVFDKDQMGELS